MNMVDKRLLAVTLYLQQARKHEKRVTVNSHPFVMIFCTLKITLQPLRRSWWARRCR